MDAKGRFKFLQWRGDFVAGGQFRSGWAFLQPILQLQNEERGLQNGTRVPRSGFAAAKPVAKWGYGCDIGILKDLGISQSISQLRNGAKGYEMALVCQRGVSQLRKFSQRGCMGLRNHFAAKGRFAAKP